MFFEVDIFGNEIITYKHVIQGYCNGVFPMGDDIDENSVKWYYTSPRGIIKLTKGQQGIKISRSLKQAIRKKDYQIDSNTRFAEVIRACANRENTWINKKIISLYEELYQKKIAHSVEVFFDGELCGGLYGIIINKAFFGESMFSIKSNASKIAFVYLYHYLLENDFKLLDIQMVTPVFESFGAIKISFKKYKELLDGALS